MPTVPTYDQPQVEARPLPGARAQSVASPGLLGGAAEGQMRSGAALSKAGGALSTIATDMQERENLRAVQEAAAAWGERAQQWKLEAQQKRPGVSAQGLVTDFDEWHKKQLDEILPRFANEAQRQAFHQIVRTRGLAVRGDVAGFEVGETRKANLAAAEANARNLIDMGATTATPEASAELKKQLIASTRAYAATQGAAPEVEQAAVAKYLTEFHVQRIQHLARTDPVGAKEYFDANKHEIAGSRQAEVGEFAARVGANAVGEAKATEAWMLHGPKDDRAPIELDKMEDALRKELKGNEPALDSAIKRLRDRAQAFKVGRQERGEQLEASVNRAILDGASRAQVARMPEFNQLPPEQARRIDAYLENREYTRAARAAADAQRADAEESRRERRLTRASVEAAMRVSDPDVLAGMTRSEVINLLPVLGAEHTSNLLQRWDSFAKSKDRLIEARIDKQLFDTIALDSGLRPNDTSKSEEEKNQLVRLQNHVEGVIDTEQRSKGRALTRDEKAAIMRRELDNQVMVGRWWWTDQAVAAPMLTPDQAGRAYVVVNGREVKLSSIPPTDRAQITQALRSRGLPVTEQAIAELYEAGKRRR